ncbi:Alpha/Beta hydrolase protein [Sordaria brevicollis]|uniref:feruloyl esterase n=1 Tax=Sordaria brevicollis TaxID=83679 RepID=A0AAE0UCX6_SORBR|nr:Alpha/Beta hydrolase protein [Sordaria brevicollis]
MAPPHRGLWAFTLLLLTTLTTLLPFTSAAPSPGCSKPATLRNGQQLTTTINGKSRQYTLRVPDNYNPSNNAPYRLIFLWHQLGGSAQKIIQGEDPNRGGVLPYYGLPPLDTNKSAIYVVPQGLNQGWGNQNGEDVSFFDNMLQTVTEGLCVDTNLVFSTGFSYGGAMSYSLACSRPSKIRAVAVISGSLLSGCSGGNEPVAYYAQHGTSDSVLNISGGRQLRDRFVRNNKCSANNGGEPQPGQGGRSTRVEYQGCAQDKPVVWVVHGGDHNPSQKDSGSNEPFAPRNTWEFFSRFK